MGSQQETQRPLMTPGEIMQMPAGDALIFLASHPPIKARKLRYFEDQNFIDRVGGLERPAAYAPGPGLVGLPVPRPSLAAKDFRGLARRLDPDLTGDQGRLKEGEDSEQAQRDPGSVQDQIARYYARLQDRGGREL